jgi:hypothetical protein
VDGCFCPKESAVFFGKTTKLNVAIKLLFDKVILSY